MPRVYKFPKDTDAICEAFANYVGRWKPKLNLDEWEILLHTATGAEAKEQTFHDGQSGVGATTKVSPHYLRALISLNLPDGTEWTDEDLEMTAVHELLHVLLSQVTTFADEHEEDSILCKQYHIAEEQVCTRLERIVYGAEVQLSKVKAVAMAATTAAVRSERESRQPARAAGKRRSGGSSRGRSSSPETEDTPSG